MFGEVSQLCRLVLVLRAPGSLLIRKIHMDWPQHCDQKERDFLLISNYWLLQINSFLFVCFFFFFYFFKGSFPLSPPIFKKFYFTTHFFEIGVKIFYMYMSLVWIFRLISMFFLSDQQLWLNCQVCAVTVKLWRRKLRRGQGKGCKNVLRDRSGCTYRMCKKDVFLAGVIRWTNACMRTDLYDSF